MKNKIFDIIDDVKMDCIIDIENNDFITQEKEKEIINNIDTFILKLKDKINDIIED